ncbi:MAG: transcriptional regulator, GntR family with aminotransferase domain [Solirubrobacterales bacterium]|nr:transcriptional regulator, GntR family with aminotransferase domain [Solirubrobacterales bacterium]
MDQSHQGQLAVQFVTDTEFTAALGAWTHRPGPRYARLAEAAGDAIAQGLLPAGTRLPTERSLAQQLQVSRGTIVAAYAELADRGLVARRQGSGTTVTAPGRRTTGRHLRNQGFDRQISGPPVPIDLSMAAPVYDAIVADLGADTTAVLAAGAPVHGYAPLGLPALREGIADRLTARGVPTTAAQILVTAGAQGALQLIIAAFVRAGDHVVVENPTYPGALELLSRSGAALDGIPRDHAGPRPGLFRRALEAGDTALALLVPTCHNPTGTTMSEQRRHEVLAAVRDHDALLVEDLTMADMSFSGVAPADLVALAPDRVIALGSFSKILWGGLRTGWIRADPATILRLGRLRTAQDMGSGQLDQAACLAALPRLDEIIAARRRMARERHDVLRQALAEQLPDWEVQRCEGGYSLWIRLPRANAAQVVAAALQHGVAIAGGGIGGLDDSNLDHVRVCFTLEPDVLVEAASRLRRAWEQVCAGGETAPALAAI